MKIKGTRIPECVLQAARAKPWYLTATDLGWTLPIYSGGVPKFGVQKDIAEVIFLAVAKQMVREKHPLAFCNNYSLTDWTVVAEGKAGGLPDYVSTCCWSEIHAWFAAAASVTAKKPMSSEEYVKAKGLVCPFCSGRVQVAFSGQVGTSKITVSTVTVANKCLDCDKEWNERYDLAGYEETEA